MEKHNKYQFKIQIAIQSIQKDFNITRTTNDGTSWVIPAINKNSFKIESIVKAIISEFYIPIKKAIIIRYRYSYRSRVL